VPPLTRTAWRKTIHAYQFLVAGADLNVSPGIKWFDIRDFREHTVCHEWHMLAPLLNASQVAGMFCHLIL
jgi:hypothetical protein